MGTRPVIHFQKYFESKSTNCEVKYFHDTGTALIEFSTQEVVETKEINENLYIDLDSSGNIVSITVEHANMQSNLPKFVL